MDTVKSGPENNWGTGNARKNNVEAVSPEMGKLYLMQIAVTNYFFAQRIFEIDEPERKSQSWYKIDKANVELTLKNDSRDPDETIRGLVHYILFTSIYSPSSPPGYEVNPNGRINIKMFPGAENVISETKNNGHYFARINLHELEKLIKG